MTVTSHATFEEAFADLGARLPAYLKGWDTGTVFAIEMTEARHATGRGKGTILAIFPRSGVVHARDMLVAYFGDEPIRSPHSSRVIRDLTIPRPLCGCGAD